MSALDLFKPSNRVRQWWRKLKEKWNGTYYEGPDPPPRLAEEVKMFVVFYPLASKREWADFALKHAVNSYRSGFIRGHEWMQRGWEGPVSDEDQERIQEAQANNWSLAEQNPQWDKILTQGHFPQDPLKGLNDAERQRFMDMLQGPQRGMFPVEIKLPTYDEEEEEEEADE